MGREDAEQEATSVTSNTQEPAKDTWPCPLSGKKSRALSLFAYAPSTSMQTEEIKEEGGIYNNFLPGAKCLALPPGPAQVLPPRPGPGTPLPTPDSPGPDALWLAPAPHVGLWSWPRELRCLPRTPTGCYGTP